jgi:rhodanese-related sulfurtransferase
MSCSCNSIISQTLAIIIIGGAIGIADSLARPVTLTRAAPPPIEIPKPADPKSPPTQTPIAAPPTANPAFTFTKKEALPTGHITVEDAKALFDNQAFFIDARKLEAYQEGHVKGSYRMAEADFQFGNPPMLAAIPRDATLVVYCSGGHCDESEQVAKLINGSGYQKVYVMHDGIPGWQAMGYPSEKGDGQ